MRLHMFVSRSAYLGVRNRTRRDYIRRNAQWTKFKRNIVRKSIDTRFGHGNVGLEYHPCIVHGGTDEDDASSRT